MWDSGTPGSAKPHSVIEVLDDSSVRRECVWAVDGTKDGLIDDPIRCRFDFKTIEGKLRTPQSRIL
jgi:hypothetical protein